MALAETLTSTNSDKPTIQDQEVTENSSENVIFWIYAKVSYLVSDVIEIFSKTLYDLK